MIKIIREIKVNRLKIDNKRYIVFVKTKIEILDQRSPFHLTHLINNSKLHFLCYLLGQNLLLQLKSIHFCIELTLFFENITGDNRKSGQTLR